MIKWLLLAGIVYFIYRFYLLPPSLEKARDDSQKVSEKADRKADEEYTDYEEID